MQIALLATDTWVPIAFAKNKTQWCIKVAANKQNNYGEKFNQIGRHKSNNDKSICFSIFWFQYEDTDMALPRQTFRPTDKDNYKIRYAFIDRQNGNSECQCYTLKRGDVINLTTRCFRSGSVMENCVLIQKGLQNSAIYTLIQSSSVTLLQFSDVLSDRYTQNSLYFIKLSWTNKLKCTSDRRKHIINSCTYMSFHVTSFFYAHLLLEQTQMYWTFFKLDHLRCIIIIIMISHQCHAVCRWAAAY